MVGTYKRMGQAIVIGISVLVAVIVCGCAKKDSGDRETEDTRPKIIVGSDNYPPFNYTDTDGEVTGIDVDLAIEAFRRMGYKTVFVKINWEEKKNLLAEGKVDCVWGCFSMNGREDEYRWAGPYMISRQVAAVEKDSDINSLQDLEGKRLAVQSTTKPEELFREPEANGLPVPGEIIAVEERELIYSFLSKGYVDAIAAHETAILQYMSDYGIEYRILDEPLQEVGLGVAFDVNDDRGLEQQLSKTFQEMKKDGTEEKYCF